MERKIRWGIIGAGAVVNRWLRGAFQLDDMEIIAIASRHMNRAEEVAQKWKIPKVMSCEEIMICPDIDVMYIAVPHTLHKEFAIKAMENGKHVLVEKPAALNSVEFQKMIECARVNQVFLMEAVWTRFFPIMDYILQEIKNGRIGKIRIVQVDFSFQIPERDTSRLVDLNLGGGSLLDTGVYNFHFAHMILGKFPVHVKGCASFDTDECHYQVDEQAAYIGQYDKGELAVMLSGIRTETLHTAFVYGTKGYMVIPIFWKPTNVEIVNGCQKEIIQKRVPQKFEEIQDEGYQYEIAHVNNCIRQAQKESPLIPLRITLQVLQQMDKLRKEWNYIYPHEDKHTLRRAKDI